MKVLTVTMRQGKRIGIMVDWSRLFLFDGEEQPAEEQLLTLELPGLRSFSQKSLTAWLAAYYREHRPDDAPALTSRREIARLPRACWRPAVLDDFVDSHDAGSAMWHVQAHFSLEEFRDFAARHAPAAEARLAQVLATKPGPSRVAALRRHQTYVERVYCVLFRVPGRMTQEAREEAARLARLEWETIKAAADDPRGWVAPLGRLKHDEVRQKALRELARAARALAKTDPEAASECILAVGAHSRLRNDSNWDEKFWKIAGPLIRLGPSATGITVDLTNARQVQVAMGWDLVRAQRVGTIVPGRTALLVHARGSRITYVEGERKLKFRLARTGGSLQKHGCTLTLKADTGRALAPALLEIERLDTLANLDPQQALESIAHLNLPADHVVYRTAAAARDDPRQARALAVLLAELRYGIDAHVARRLTRCESTRRR
jgi:hypothetical protein